MDRWHVGRGGQKFGPYPWAQIVEMARTGQLSPADLLWQEGTASWVAASTFGARLPFAGPGAMPPPAGWGAAPGAPPGPSVPSGPRVDYKAAAGRLGFHFKRAMEWNLHDMPVTPAETEELVALGVDDEDARRYHAWRRSVLWTVFAGGVVTAVLGTISAAATEGPQRTQLGGSVEVLRVLAFWVIPIYAWLAARVWARHRRSRRLLTIGWCISFAMPLILALVPLHWAYDLGEADPGMRAQVEATMRLLGAIASYVTLMPAVLALIPGIMRACLRIKVLLPQSILPGWFLVGMAPLWMFLFLVLFVTINQVAGDALLILGVLAVTSAPVLYIVHVGLFTRPVGNKEDQQRLLQVQRQVRLILSGGVVCLVIWLFTASVMGTRIVGVDAQSSMVRPWSVDLLRFPIEYATHSLFTMALAADMFMAMNLSVWLYTKQFVASPEAKEYDRRMAEIEEAGGKE
jgi:hypothetical protein